MSQYKEVFELAVSKGYKMFFLSHPFPDKIKNSKDEMAREFELLEISRVQKWLRDTHSIIVLVRPYNLGKSYFTSVLAPVIDRDFTTSEKPTYEESLLTGIKEALQLI